jgi:hypothetical protein
MSLTASIKYRSFAERYLAGSRKLRARLQRLPGYACFKAFAEFLDTRCSSILLHSSVHRCPYCGRQYRSYPALLRHLRGRTQCGLEFRRLLDEVVDEYLRLKGKR